MHALSFRLAGLSLEVAPFRAHISGSAHSFAPATFASCSSRRAASPCGVGGPYLPFLGLDAPPEGGRGCFGLVAGMWRRVARECLHTFSTKSTVDEEDEDVER